MRLLLDTHAFLWWIGGDRRLSARAREAIAEPESDVVVSAVSVWEIAIKAGLGQLQLPADLGGFLREELARNQFECLPVSFEHAVGVRDLPRHHGDPFDRLLIAQSKIEGSPLVTADSAIATYGIEVLW